MRVPAVRVRWMAVPTQGPRGPQPSRGPPISRRTYLPFLDVTRILAVLGVVAIHVIGTGVNDGTAGTGMRVLKIALVAAVPIFVMMSGALNLDPRAHEVGVGEFLRRRAVRIVPALAFWSVFYMAVIRGLVDHEDVSPDMSLELLVMGKPYSQLYFLFAIGGLYLMAPVLHAFLERDEGRRAWAVGIIATAWSVLAVVPGQLVEAGVITTAPVEESAMTWSLLLTGYFVLGHAMVVRPLPRPAAITGLALAPVLVAVMSWAFPRNEPQMSGPDPSWWAMILRPDYPALPVVLYSFVLMAALTSLCQGWRVGPRARGLLRRLGEATFGVFLVHYAVLVLLQHAVPALASPEPGPCAVAWVLTVGISSVIALVGERIPGLRLIL